MERSEKAVSGDWLPASCGEDFQPKKDVNLALGDFDLLLAGDEDRSESKEGSV